MLHAPFCVLACFVLAAQQLAAVQAVYVVPASKPAASITAPLSPAARIVLHEDGVPQTIATEAQPTNSPSVVVLLDASHFAPHVGLSGSGSLPATVLTESIKRSAAGAIRKFGRDSSIAFYSSRNQLHVIRDFPSTTAVPIALTSSEIRAALGIFDPPVVLSPNAAVRLEIGNIKRFELAEMEAIANHVSDRPGRKALVWFCPGTSILMPSEGDPLYYSWFAARNALQSAHVAVYTVDCAGNSGWLADALQKLATDTGGHYYDGASKLDQAILQAIGDSQTAHLVTWSPTGIANKPTHDLKLRGPSAVAYPHLLTEPVVPHREANRLVLVESAFVTPLEANALNLRLALDPEEGGLNADLTIDPKNILLRSDAGKQVGSLDMIFAFYDRDGRRLPAGKRDSVSLSFTEQDLESFRSNPYTIRQFLTAPSGAAVLRIAVRDGNSGALGSCTRSLPPEHR